MAGDKIVVVQKSCLKARQKAACFDIKKVARQYAELTGKSLDEGMGAERIENRSQRAEIGGQTERNYKTLLPPKNLDF